MAQLVLFDVVYWGLLAILQRKVVVQRRQERRAHVSMWLDVLELPLLPLDQCSHLEAFILLHRKHIQPLRMVLVEVLGALLRRRQDWLRLYDPVCHLVVLGVDPLGLSQPPWEVHGRLSALRGEGRLPPW